jgi:hypothetical protein
MVKNRKYRFITALSILVSVIMIYLLTSYDLNRPYIDSISNSTLYDLDGKLRILKKSNQEALDTQELKITVEREIAGDLIVLSKTNPKIENLLGTPIDALQQVIEYEKTDGLLKSFEDKND